MSGRETTPQLYQQLVDRNRTLQQTKQQLTNSEFQLRSRLLELQELKKFVQGSELEQEMQGLREHYESFKDYLVELEGRKERVRQRAEL